MIEYIHSMTSEKKSCYKLTLQQLQHHLLLEFEVKLLALKGAITQVDTTVKKR
jgi:hypothetical protein